LESTSLCSWYKKLEGEIIEEIFRDYYRDELTLYSKENIITCCKLLVRHSMSETISGGM